MPDFAKITEQREIDDLIRVANTPRYIWIHRPILVHGRSEDGKACPCCGSEKASIAERREHIDVLIDRYTGQRRSLHRQRTKRAERRWHEFASTAEKVEMPLRCYDKQLPLVLNRKWKILFAFGGNRSGKSQSMVEWLIDQWLLHGRRGARFWWVAPTREKTRVGVIKLVEGEVTDRRQAPAIHPLLVASYPRKVTDSDQAIRLIDGSAIELKYAGRDGKNLQGDAAIAVGVDEGCAIPHEINFTILLNRLLDSGGQLMVATTPRAGHWLQEHNKRAKPIEEAANDANYDGTVAANLSCYDNPWISKEEIDKTIEALGGPEDPRVKREVFGMWVAEGMKLWPHFSHARHIVEWPSRDVSRYGYTDITHLVCADSFMGHTEATRIPFFLGQDFNYRPFSTAVLRVIVENGKDTTNPANWILYVEDEVIRNARTSDDFCEWLAGRAGSMNGRGLSKTYFAGAHVFADKTGLHQGGTHGGDRTTPDINIMRAAGFVVRPPRYIKGKPSNPPRQTRIGFLNHLMHANRLRINGTRCPKGVEALDNEIRNAKGDTQKTPGSYADKLSGITDAIGYGAYGAMWSQANPEESAA